MGKPHSLFSNSPKMEHVNNKLIIECLRIEERGEKVARLGAFSSTDWEQILTQARLTGLTPLIARQIYNLVPEISPPEEIRKELRQSLFIGTGKNLRLNIELGKMLHRFKELEIPVIVLKGAYLAEIVYEDLGSRIMGDIDLLVKVGDLKKSSMVLAEMGYQSDALLPDAESHYFEKHHLPDFYKLNASPIEIHWTIVNNNSPFRIELNDVWNEALEATIAGAPALVLSPLDQILHLCMHNYGHYFNLGLRPFIDLMHVTRHYRESIQWEQLKQKTQDSKSSRCVFLMLYTTNQLFGALSKEVVEALKPASFDPQLFDAFLNRIINIQPPAEESNIDFHTAAPSLYFFKLIGNLGIVEKVALLWNRIFLPTKTLAQLYEIPYISPGLYFYYLLRLKDLLSQYGRLGYQKATHGIAEEVFTSPETRLAEWIASE